MKRPKTEAKSPKTPAANPADAEHPCRIPTTAQLAQLAATLAKDLNNPFQLSRAEATLLAYAAWHLWHGADRVRNEVARDYYVSPSERAAAREVARPKRYPLGKAEFLRIMLPKQRAEARAKAWRDYNLKLAGKNSETATVVELQAASSQWTPIQTQAEFVFSELGFRRWWDKYHAAQVSAGRRNAAAKRKKKAKKRRKARPPVDQLRNALLPHLT